MRCVGIYKGKSWGKNGKFSKKGRVLVWSKAEHSCTVHNKQKMLFRSSRKSFWKGASAHVLFTKC